MLLYAALALWTVLLACCAIFCLRAPEGYEDRAGFHFAGPRQFRLPGSARRSRRRRQAHRVSSSPAR